MGGGGGGRTRTEETAHPWPSYPHPQLTAINGAWTSAYILARRAFGRPNVWLIPSTLSHRLTGRRNVRLNPSAPPPTTVSRELQTGFMCARVTAISKLVLGNRLVYGPQTTPYFSSLPSAGGPAPAPP